jgi:SAM-dependent methyltransferase
MAVEAALTQNDVMKRILDLVKAYTPSPIRRMTRRIKRRARWIHNARQPVAAVFREVYERNLWGGAQGTFYSGPGSESHAATAYAEGIRSFIASRKIKSIVDLGCGDFRIASRFVTDDVSYVGVDIVEPLVRQNTALYHSDKVSFACLDIIDDELPDGELCLIREVFQHLSNAQILKVIPKLRRFKHAVYTACQPALGAPCTPNRDISHGVDTRLWLGSALFLDQPPFNVPTGLLFEEPVTIDLCGPEQLRTYLMWP